MRQTRSPPSLLRSAERTRNQRLGDGGVDGPKEEETVREEEEEEDEDEEEEEANAGMPTTGTETEGEEVRIVMVADPSAVGTGVGRKGGQLVEHGAAPCSLPISFAPTLLPLLFLIPPSPLLLLPSMPQQVPAAQGCDCARAECMEGSTGSSLPRAQGREWGEGD